MTTVVIVTGGFDPCHEGHISYLKDAKTLGDILVVGINSDDWLVRKKGFRFMPWETRAEVLRNLRCVDYVFNFDDSNGTANDAIWKMACRYPFHALVFANGGDRTHINIPEMLLENEAGFSKRLKFVFGVGGDDKQNSSSDILKEYRDYIIQSFNGSQKWTPEGYDRNSSLSSSAKAGEAPKEVPVVHPRWTDTEWFFSPENNREERDEILHSSKRVYSDIYDYSTWGYGPKQNKN